MEEDWAVKSKQSLHRSMRVKLHITSQHHITSHHILIYYTLFSIVILSTNTTATTVTATATATATATDTIPYNKVSMTPSEDNRVGFKEKLWQVHKFGGTSVANGEFVELFVVIVLLVILLE